MYDKKLRSVTLHALYLPPTAWAETWRRVCEDGKVLLPTRISDDLFFSHQLFSQFPHIISYSNVYSYIKHISLSFLNEKRLLDQNNFSFTPFPFRTFARFQ